MGLDQGINNLAGAKALFVYKWEVVDGNGIPLAAASDGGQAPFQSLRCQAPASSKRASRVYRKNNGLELAFILRIHSLGLEGENAHPGTIGINGNESAFFKFFLELPDGLQDQISDRFRYDVLCADLNDTGPTSSPRGKQGAKVQVMGKNDIAVSWA